MSTRILWAVLCVFMVSACVSRVAALSPRRPANADHAVKACSECLDCHDVAKIRDHDADDDCLRCHKGEVYDEK